MQMAISSVGREVSRFLGYFFDSIKNKKQPSKKYSKIHFNLDCAGAEAIFDKAKVYDYRYVACGLDLSGAKTDLRSRPLKGGGASGLSGLAVRLFNIITLMTDSFGSVVALQGLLS